MGPAAGQLVAAAPQSFEEFIQQRPADAAELAPDDWTVGRSRDLGDFPQNAKGTELLEQLTRLRDEVAAGVRG